MERIQELLLAHERAVQGQIESSEIKKDSKSTEKSEDEDSNAIELKNVTATWPQTEEPVLKNLNLSVEKGALIGVIGQARDLRTPSQCLADTFSDFECTSISLIVISGSLKTIPDQSWKWKIFIFVTAIE